MTTASQGKNEQFQHLTKKNLSKSVQKIVPAGGIPNRAIDMYAQEKEISMRSRTYKKEDDLTRDIEYKEALNRIDQGYKRVVNDNSWNEQKRLSPKFKIYHNLNHSFRKSPRDLDQVESQERDEKFQFVIKQMLNTKKASQERFVARQLERKIIQAKAEQPLSEQSKLEVVSFQNTDPDLAVELLQKKKWTNVQKDPSRILKDQFVDNTSYWQYLNNLPKKSVQNIVTPKIMKADKEGCERILNKILDQKQSEDNKKNKQQLERSQLRHKLKQRHNDFVQLEKTCGVRLGSLNQPKRTADNCVIVPLMANFSDVNLEPLIEDQSKLEFSKEISKIEAKTPQEHDAFNSKLTTFRYALQNEPLQVIDEQQNGFIMKFGQKKSPERRNPREQILSMSKPEYQGKDFFQRVEFRGLLLADYQEAIGTKAFQFVEDLNRSTVSQFQQLKSFQDSISQKKQIQTFYKDSQSLPRTKRQYDQTNMTGFHKSLQSLGAVQNTRIGNSIIQQKILEMQNQVRAGTAVEKSPKYGNRDQKIQALARQVVNSAGIEASQRPRTTIKTEGESQEFSDRVFKNEAPRLQTVQNRLTQFWPRLTQTSYGQRQIKGTSPDSEDIFLLQSQLLEFENRVVGDYENRVREACRYPNVQLLKALQPRTSQSTRNKNTVQPNQV